MSLPDRTDAGRDHAGTALVTGASSGIGREIARELAGRGMRVHLVARRAERLAEIARELSSAGDGPPRRGLPESGEVVSVPADLADPGSVPAILEATGSDLDLLVANAGIGEMIDFADLAPERIARTIDVNVTSHVRLVRAALPGMIRRKSGGVLFVASMAAIQPAPTMALYSATKAFLLAFAQALRAEVEGVGIRVSCICPGPVRTEFFDANDVRLGNDFVRDAADPAEVAREALEGLDRDRLVTIPGGLKPRVLALVPRLLPRSIAGRMAASVMRKRREAAERE